MDGRAWGRIRTGETAVALGDAAFEVKRQRTQECAEHSVGPVVSSAARRARAFRSVKA
jgi:hypothetical protein